ncbi:MAG TPA: PIN domain-containing protein [Thermoanaerobaculia bacterium]
MILIDTSGVLAWIDGRQRHHQGVVSAMRSIPGPYLLSPFILAELDYLITTRVGTKAARLFLGEVARGAYQLESFSASDVQRALEVLDRFADQEIGIADASIVVLAERYRINAVLTLDERHFRPLRTLAGAPFRLVPLDS